VLIKNEKEHATPQGLDGILQRFTVFRLLRKDRKKREQEERGGGRERDLE
jgi:hypothetical protein